jgi:hypothetical protein
MWLCKYNLNWVSFLSSTTHIPNAQPAAMLDSTDTELSIFSEIILGSAV